MATVRAEVFPAGEFLADELEERGWTQAEFAEIIGRPPQFVSEIIAGKKEITRESAAQLGAALGTSPETWLKLQDQYFLWRQEQDERTQAALGEVRVRARLKELAPISILVKRGFITSSRLEEQAEQLAQLYGMPSIEGEPDLQIAARRTNENEQLSATQRAWVACVRAVARRKTVAEYSEEALKSLAVRLSRAVRDEADFATLPELFAECGVALVYVEAFPSSKLDGCSFMLEETPIIGISGRGKRLDKVLFTLLHEVAHIVLGHLEGGGVIVDEPDDHHTLGVEDDADKLAGGWMFPGTFPAAPARVGADWVAQVANTMGVHQILVVGRLQNDHVLNWRTALVKGAPTVDAQLALWS
ncbi:HigA family addiction module antitoxin [Rathayibacter festucae]|uniref:HigA family addiction module antitoxin n=1 Tax=Rathayibacter festucae TaxID=110937 RepID=UPI001FB23BCD|nr:HigA family addiction module antitoxin [Rathayibacter festucae]MCJ1701974.1 HigA family addiction module antitoxin [Rathayibacter festucae]